MKSPNQAPEAAPGERSAAGGHAARDLLERAEVEADDLAVLYREVRVRELVDGGLRLGVRGVGGDRLRMEGGLQ